MYLYFKFWFFVPVLVNVNKNNRKKTCSRGYHKSAQSRIFLRYAFHLCLILTRAYSPLHHL
nr:MAG TPA: hypothetical protein [Caudoviricetes sp.]